MSDNQELDLSALGYEVSKNVTRDFFVIPDDGTKMALKFESKFEVDESITIKTRSKDDNKGPMEIANVINLVTGDEGRLIGNAMVKDELRRAYPNDSYVGKAFVFAQGKQKESRGGNRYRTFKITELRPKSGTDSSASNKPAAKK